MTPRCARVNPFVTAQRRKGLIRRPHTNTVYRPRRAAWLIVHPGGRFDRTCGSTASRGRDGAGRFAALARGAGAWELGDAMGACARVDAVGACVWAGAVAAWVRAGAL